MNTVAKKGSHFQVLFRRLLPRLAYKPAIWAVAHRLCRVVWMILHEGFTKTSNRCARCPQP